MKIHFPFILSNVQLQYGFKCFNVINFWKHQIPEKFQLTFKLFLSLFFSTVFVGLLLYICEFIIAQKNTISIIFDRWKQYFSWWLYSSVFICFLIFFVFVSCCREYFFIILYYQFITNLIIYMDSKQCTLKSQ